MNKHSIDRINPNGNYEIDNCRFIEMSKNIGRMNSQHKTVKILQYDLQGNLIREWESIALVEKELGFLHTAIGNCLKGRSKSSNGFRWKYKNKEK